MSAGAGLLKSGPTALIVLAGWLAYQQFKDRLLAPVVYGRTLNLSPIVVLVAVLMGGKVLGVLGAVLALPIAAAMARLVEFVIENRRLPLTG